MFSDLLLAFATAERTTFSISVVALLLVNLSVINASLTSFPRIKSTTSRAFCGDILIKRPEALLITRPPNPWRQVLPQPVRRQARRPCLSCHRRRYVP